jgi:hypothetical protein
MANLREGFSNPLIVSPGSGFKNPYITEATGGDYRNPFLVTDSGMEGPRRLTSSSADIPMVGETPFKDFSSQFAMHFADSAFLNIPRVLSEDFRDLLENQQSQVGQVGAAVGELGGFLVSPFKIAKAVSAPVKAAITRALPEAYNYGLRGFVKAAMEEGATLSLASALSADTEGFVERLGGSFALGASFPVLGAIDVPGHPVLSLVARIGIGNWAQDALMGRSFSDERTILQKVFDYGLNSYFLKNHIPHVTREEYVARARGEMKQLNKEGYELYGDRWQELVFPLDEKGNPLPDQQWLFDVGNNVKGFGESVMKKFGVEYAGSIRSTEGETVGLMFRDPLTERIIEARSEGDLNFGIALARKDVGSLKEFLGREVSDVGDLTKVVKGTMHSIDLTTPAEKDVFDFKAEKDDGITIRADNPQALKNAILRVRKTYGDEVSTFIDYTGDPAQLLNHPFDILREENGRIFGRLLKQKEIEGRIRALEKENLAKRRISPEEYSALRELAKESNITRDQDFLNLARKVLGRRSMPLREVDRITPAEASLLREKLRDLRFTEQDDVIEVGDKKRKYVTKMSEKDLMKIYSAKEMQKEPLRIFKVPYRILREYGQVFIDYFHTPNVKATADYKRELMERKDEYYKNKKDFGIGRNEWYRIQVKILADQPESLTALKNQGVDPNEITLTAKEEGFKNYILKSLVPFLNRFNDARAAAGKEPVSAPEGVGEGQYFPFIRDLVLAEKLGLDISTAKTMDITKILRFGDTTNKYTERQKKSELPFLLDGEKVYLDYLDTMTKYIHRTPALAKQRAIVEQMRRDNVNMRMVNWLDKTINFYSGKQRTDENYEGFQKVAARLNENIMFAVLSYNIRSALVQVSSLRNTVVACGSNNVMSALADWALGTATETRKELRERVFKESNAIITRSPEAILETAKSQADRRAAFRELTAGEKTVVGRAVQNVVDKGVLIRDVLGRAGLKPLSFLDRITAEVTWLAAEKRAKEIGIRGEKIKTYADEIVNLSQGVGGAEHISYIQRTPGGKFLTFLQTFTINNWGFLTSDVLGWKNPQFTEARAEKVVRLAVATAVFSYLFEDVFENTSKAIHSMNDEVGDVTDYVLPMFSPFPQPVKEFKKSLEEQEAKRGAAIAELVQGRSLTASEEEALNTGAVKRVGKALLRGGLEFAEDMPIVGGPIRYGSTWGGPGVEVAQNLAGVIQGKVGDALAAKTIGQMVGVPGSAQIYKMFKTHNEQEVEKKRMIAQMLRGL